MLFQTSVFISSMEQKRRRKAKMMAVTITVYCFFHMIKMNGDRGCHSLNSLQIYTVYVGHSDFAK